MKQAEDHKIKVLRIISRLNIGGPALHAILLSTEFDKERFETSLVIGRPDDREGDMSGLARAKGAHLINIPELKREISPADIIALFKLLQIIIKTRPHIVHTHTAKAGTLGRIAAFIAGVPVRIHTFHGHVFDGYFNTSKAKFFIFVEKCLALVTDKIIAVSDSVRDEITDKFRIAGRDKCEVIRLGLDLEKYLKIGPPKDGIRNKLNLDNDTLLVGIVGRLVPVKNHRMFLDAVRNLIDKGVGKNVVFVVIGDGELKDELIEYAKKIRVDNVVRFTGWADDMASVYAGLNIVALTSLNEGTPVSLIEASASARPVVSTDVGGVRDIVKDGQSGFLVNSNDIEAFSEKLLELLRDEGKRARMGAAGREIVKNTFSKERLINDIENLYQRCIIRKIPTLLQ